jgi:FkbM family methyltransferase
MHERELDELRRAAALQQSSRGQKLLRAPLRMSYSLAMTALAQRHGIRHAHARTFWNEQMNIVFPEPGSVALSRYRFIEEGLSSIFLTNITAGMTVFDIGAHFGYFTLLSAWLVGAGGQVHSFEPTPSTFEVLQSNAAGRGNIHLNNLALFNRADELTFHDFGLEFSQYNSLTDGRISQEDRRRTPPRPYTVKTVTVDQYVSDTGAWPAFIKIDAENAELEILQGMERTLTEIKPMITLEVGDGDPAHASSKPVQLLLDRGYRAYQYDPKTRSIRRHQPQSEYHFDNLLFDARDRRD